jgi:hypothetical protein
MTGAGQTPVNGDEVTVGVGRATRGQEWASNAQLKAAGLKHCAGCDEIKPRTGFSPNGLSPKGFVYVSKLCKPCNAAKALADRAGKPRAHYQKPKKVLRTDIPQEEMTDRELRNVGLKRCAICREIKSREQFYATSTSDSSVSSGCRPCEAAKARTRRAADPEKYRLRDREPKRRERKRVQAQEKVASSPRNLCECGCGGETQRRFVRGHHRRMPDAVPPRPAQQLDKRLRDNSAVTEDGHWLWQRRISADGYAQIKAHRSSRPAARVSYEVFIETVPEGYVVQQVCGLRECIAPEHLEAISVAESTRRGDNDPLKNFAAYYERRRAATHCLNGHPWDEENTRRAHGQRWCRTCIREAQRERREDPVFKAAERERERELYDENRDRILARKRAWYEENADHVRARSSASKRASYALAKSEGRCAFGSGSACADPAVPGRVMCEDHQRIQNERNWVHTTESVWESYFERGLTGDQCWLCSGTITADDPLNHDHLVPRSLDGPNEVWNFAPSHRSCNIKRLNLPLAETLLVYPNHLREALLEIPKGILD